MGRLARDYGWRRGIELGVGSGLLMRRLLALGVNMIGVDIGRNQVRYELQKDIALEYMGTCRMLWMPTRHAAEHVEDGWADFCFVDAAHSYYAVKDDIALWQPKVRPGGWFGGHDYHEAHPGVVKAVDEAFGSAVKHLPGHIWVRAC
jgi:hypothetical protein